MQKYYNRRDEQTVNAKIYEKGDEDGFQVWDESGELEKQGALFEHQHPMFKKYYTDTVNGKPATPYVLQEGGIPVSVEPGGYLVYFSDGRVRCWDKATFESTHTHIQDDEQMITPAQTAIMLEHNPALDFEVIDLHGDRWRTIAEVGGKAKYQAFDTTDNTWKNVSQLPSGGLYRVKTRAIQDVAKQVNAVI